MYPTLVTLGPVVISSFGVMLAFAFLAGAFVVWKKGREEHFEEEDLFDATLLSVFWGLVGARGVYVVGHLNDFGFDVIKIVALTRFPGLSFLGGLGVGLLALSLFARGKKWDVFETLDVFALGLALAQVLGFVGAFLNGTGYGTRSNIAWAVTFPGVEGARHPTQLYGFLLVLMLFWLLMKVFKEYRTYEWYKGSKSEADSGLVFFGYILGLGLLGVVLATLKPAQLYWGKFSVEGWVSLGLTLVGLIGAYWRSGRILKEDVGGVGMGMGRLMAKTRAGGGLQGRTKRGRKKRERDITAGMDVK